MAPFDADFYLILNLACGGTNGFFPDNAQNPGGKPWSNTSPHAPKEFWNGKGQWQPTWRNDGSTHMEIDYVRVWSLSLDQILGLEVPKWRPSMPIST
ncbi:UNVERIFIED_CONTAM: hypothetical protein B566_EDAN018495 [Ephemera danica]|nr:hypothetical protein B566_EDAN018495 [Ephemera danica]